MSFDVDTKATLENFRKLANPDTVGEIVRELEKRKAELPLMVSCRGSEEKSHRATVNSYEDAALQFLFLRSMVLESGLDNPSRIEDAKRRLVYP